jgi:hypothetical protein
MGLKGPLLGGYLCHVHNVVTEALDALPQTGSFETFTQMKSLVFQVEFCHYLLISNFSCEGFNSIIIIIIIIISIIIIITIIASLISHGREPD